MHSARDNFFRLVRIGTAINAASLARYSKDLPTLQSYGLTDESARLVLDALRPIADSPEFARYVEGILLAAFEGHLAMVDNICAFSVDSPHSYRIVDEHGNTLGEDLHFDFGVYQKDNPPVPI